jgi:hypothetical protein
VSGGGSPGTSATGTTEASSPAGQADKSVCDLARIAWHDANSLKVSVAKTKAAETAVVGVAGGTSNILNEKSAAVVDAMKTLTSDAASTPARVVSDIHTLVTACEVAGE